MSDFEDDLLIEGNRPRPFQPVRELFHGLFDEQNYPRHFFCFLATANVLIVGIIAFWYIGNGMSLAPKSSNGNGAQSSAEIYTSLVYEATMTVG